MAVRGKQRSWHSGQDTCGGVLQRHLGLMPHRPEKRPQLPDHCPPHHHHPPFTAPRPAPPPATTTATATATATAPDFQGAFHLHPVAGVGTSVNRTLQGEVLIAMKSKPPGLVMLALPGGSNGFLGAPPASLPRTCPHLHSPSRRILYTLLGVSHLVPVRTGPPSWNTLWSPAKPSLTPSTPSLAGRGLLCAVTAPK